MHCFWPNITECGVLSVGLGNLCEWLYWSRYNFGFKESNLKIVVVTLCSIKRSQYLGAYSNKSVEIYESLKIKKSVL